MHENGKGSSAVAVLTEVHSIFARQRQVKISYLANISFLPPSDEIDGPSSSMRDGVDQPLVGIDEEAIHTSVSFADLTLDFTKLH